jgi:hypothetical protein
MQLQVILNKNPEEFFGAAGGPGKRLFLLTESARQRLLAATDRRGP